MTERIDGRWPAVGPLRMLALAGFVVAAGGLVLSLAIHIASLVGRPPAVGAVWPLHVALMVLCLFVYVPLEFTCSRRSWKESRRAKQAAVDDLTRHAPAWMRRLSGAAGIYGSAAIVVTWYASAGHGGSDDRVMLVGFSAVWMLGFASVLPVLYPYANPSARLRRCANRHTIPDGLDTCPQCGLRPEGANP
jgi:hypothetical protein